MKGQRGGRDAAANRGRVGRGGSAAWDRAIPALDCRYSLGRGQASLNQPVKGPYASLGPRLRRDDCGLSPSGGAPVEREWPAPKDRS